MEYIAQTAKILSLVESENARRGACVAGETLEFVRIGGGFDQFCFRESVREDIEQIAPETPCNQFILVGKVIVERLAVHTRSFDDRRFNEVAKCTIDLVFRDIFISSSHERLLHKSE